MSAVYNPDVNFGENPFLEGLDAEALKMVRAAEAMVPMLAERAEEVDRSGHVSSEVFKQLADAGFIRLLVPKRLGGAQQTLQALMAVGSALGRGCGSTAWMTQIVAGSSFLLSLFCERAQREAWEGNPDAGACAAQTKPTAMARVDGGYRISGRWSYLSGLEHAGWALLGVPDMSSSPPEILFNMVPVADGVIEHTWKVAGMRGTASNTLVLEDYFVPDHRVLSLTRAMEGEPATEYRDELLSRASFGPAVEVGLLAAPLGLTQAAIEYVLKLAPKRGITYSTYPSQSASGGFQVQVAQATVKFNAARTLTVQAVREIDAAAAQNRQLSYSDRTRIRAMLGFISSLLREAMQILIHAHGSSSFAESSPLQRMWRDLNVGASHGMITDMFGYELYGKALVGSNERLAPLV
ncbi:acyl-CoA dehydrogenase family protein [Phenylobacterium sp.]|uniref:acyl-CoA dehydrogenase family protein n=1 Tax=Phenylobacterium sp. TaxID=1871053 RepID=UPI002B48D658|nr:acyl-CoA dehydrogenase family protein [Phenylobacterium sp.]